jgi:hypothetical protein
MCWVFHEGISLQDRLASTIANSVDPQHPHSSPSSSIFRFSKLERCWQLIASKELLAFSSAAIPSLLFICLLLHRQRFRSGNRLVNPDLAGKSRWFGSASYEALRVKLISNIEHILALPQDVFRLAIVNRRRVNKPTPE